MNCTICDKRDAPNYDKQEDKHYCNQCNYWVDRASGVNFGWEELTSLLEDDTITYTIAEGAAEIEGEEPT